MLLSVLLQAAAGVGISKLGAAIGAGIAVLGSGSGASVLDGHYVWSRIRLVGEIWFSRDH